MVLLMTVKERFTWVVRRKNDFCFGACGQQNYIFHNSRGRLAIQRFQFKAVPVKMHGMNIVTLIVKD